MAKKQQYSEAAGDAAPNCVSVSGEIKALIHDHSLFFDRLVELIPPKFYLPTENQEKVWFQGLSKADKAKVKKKTVENTEKARRDRLDPDKCGKTTLDLLKESVEKEKIGNGVLDDDSEEDEECSAGPAKVGGSGGGGRCVTYEDLRGRMRRKIEELRASRGGSEMDDERRAEKDEERKRKRDEWIKKKENWIENNAIDKEISEAADGIVYGKVKLGDKGCDIDKKKRKLSKEEELNRARKLVEAKKDPEKGKLVTEEHSWQAATSRAMGVKVHDNPRLLKESIQSEKRKHKKSVEKWKERVKSRDNVRKEKQDKRKGNIQSKIEKNKMIKIERREKKLMKRPGFEGLKEGYINGN